MQGEEEHGTYGKKTERYGKRTDSNQTLDQVPFSVSFRLLSVCSVLFFFLRGTSDTGH
jgi:hypothetical protein